MTKKILITGGAGYIGSHVIKKLGEAGFNLVTYDNLSTGFQEAVTYGELIVGDLGDIETLDSLMSLHHFDAIIHLAGSVLVPESVKNPQKYYQNNTVNSFNLIKLCSKHNINNFIFSSTAAVYGSLPSGYASEENTTIPVNPYGHSKLMTEQMLSDSSSANKEFNYVALRYFNVSGADPEGKIGQASLGATHLIKVNCEAAAGKREKVSIFGTDFETPDGTGIRDYIHVTDLADAHVKALQYLLDGGSSDIFNCGYGHGFSVKEIINAVKKFTGTDYTVMETIRRDGDPAILISKVDKIKDKLNWKPKSDDLNFIIKTAFEWEKSDILKSWTDN